MMIMWLLNDDRMMRYVLVVVIAMNIVELCDGNRVEEIMNYEHWEDIQHFQDGSHLGRVPGVVAFTTDGECSDSPIMQAFRRLVDNVPDRRLFLIGEHNTVRTKDLTWYDWSSDYDFVGHYNVSTHTKCPRILFFPMGRKSRSPREFDGDADSLLQWVNNGLKLEHVPVYNALDVPIDVYWHGDNDAYSRQLAMQLSPDEHRNLNTFVGHTFTAQERDSGRFVDGFEVTHHTSFSLTHGESTSVSDWFRQFRETRDEDLKFWEAMIWSHTRRHLYNFKIPPLLPKFTSHGYKKTALPNEVLTLLRDFYDQHKHKAAIENWPRGGTQVNFDVVRTRMVPLTDEVKLKVAELIRPLLEEWCGCDLKYFTMYGLREYYNGSILRNHVDRIESHVVSSIINVYEDLDEDWELELIDFHGNKVFVSQHPGELVMYESSTLIHGRPKPLRGRVYASGFIHFHPVVNWTGRYETTPDNVIVTPQGRVPLYPVPFMGNQFSGTNPYHTRDARGSCTWPFQSCT